MKPIKHEVLEEIEPKYPCERCKRNEATCTFKECPAFMIWLTKAWAKVIGRLRRREIAGVPSKTETNA